MMYDKLLKEFEEILGNDDKLTTLDSKNKILDLIIKIKTIQAMDVNAELIRASRRVSRN